MEATIVATTVIVCTFLISCGEQVRQTQEMVKSISSLSQNATKAESISNRFAKRQQERRAKGDTLPLHYEKLLEFLPTTIAGYQSVGEPEGSTNTMAQFSMSQAKRTYRNNEGSKLTIELIDDNNNAAAYSVATMMFLVPIRTDNPEEFSQCFDPGLPDSGGWESYKKKSGTAQVLYAIGGRFLLSIKATKQSGTDIVKRIAQQLDLRALASM